MGIVTGLAPRISQGGKKQDRVEHVTIKGNVNVLVPTSADGVVVVIFQ
jgi:hypothetical protein